jgi:chemotaxis protein methyltransferase CheR
MRVRLKPEIGKAGSMSQESKIQLPAISIPEDFGFKMMQLTDVEFNLIRSLVYERFGINLTEAKRSLVVGRLQKTLRQLGFDSFMQFYEYLIRDTSGAALDALINQISTNHTFFYREGTHFVYLRDIVLPEMKARLRREQKRDFRIWCAGCSSGEEAYTIVIEMMEYFRAEYNLWDAGVLATDISTKALNKAAAGIYPYENIRNTPSYARQYFKKTQDDTWEVAAAVKNEVTFRRFNFMNRKFPFKKLFHVIFCRNVMIYFDQATRNGLIERFHASLVPGGYLFIGHSESLGREQGLFEYVMPAVYRKREL